MLRMISNLAEKKFNSAVQRRKYIETMIDQLKLAPESDSEPEPEPEPETDSETSSESSSNQAQAQAQAQDDSQDQEPPRLQREQQVSYVYQKYTESDDPAYRYKSENGVYFGHPQQQSYDEMLAHVPIRHAKSRITKYLKQFDASKRDHVDHESYWEHLIFGYE